MSSAKSITPHVQHSAHTESSRRRLQSDRWRQLGEVFSTHDARRVGIRPEQLRRATQAGDVIAVTRGAYIAAEVFRQARYERRHVLKAKAVVRLMPHHVVSHHTALAWWGLPLLRPDTERVHLLTSRTSTRTVGEVRYHRAVRRPQPDRLPFVTRGAVGLSYAVLLVARDNVTDAVVAGDVALRNGLLRRGDLERVLDKWQLRGARAARKAVSLMSPTAESVAESLVRLELVSRKMAVHPQYCVRDGRFVAYLDFLVRLQDGRRCAVEYDGEQKYTSTDVMVAEKLREDRIRELGYTMIRLTRRDLSAMDDVVARIHRVAR